MCHLNGVKFGFLYHIKLHGKANVYDGYILKIVCNKLIRTFFITQRPDDGTELGEA